LKDTFLSKNAVSVCIVDGDGDGHPGRYLIALLFNLFILYTKEGCSNEVNDDPKKKNKKKQNIFRK